MATSTGKTIRCTAAGISITPYSLRKRVARNATSNKPGRPPPWRFMDANISVRKYSTLWIGSMCPVHTKSASPAFQNLCASPGAKATVSPRPRVSRGLAEPLVAHSPPQNRQHLFLEVVDVHGRPGTRLDDVLAFEAVGRGARHHSGESEPFAGSVLDRVRVGIARHLVKGA